MSIAENTITAHILYVLRQEPGHRKPDTAAMQAGKLRITTATSFTKPQTMQDGVINIRDSKDNIAGTVRVHFKRDFPEPIIELCLKYLKKGIEEWQDRVISISLTGEGRSGAHEFP